MRLETIAATPVRTLRCTPTPAYALALPRPSARNHRMLDRVAILALLLACTSQAVAQRRIDPGDAPSLRDNEGLVAVVFDTNYPVISAKFRKVGKTIAAPPLRLAANGRTMELYAAPEGEYEWERILIPQGKGRAFYDLADDPDYRFKVRAGRINYAGDLEFRPTAVRRAAIRLVNRSLPVLDWLRANHRVVFDAMEFEYSGEFPDPFPAFHTKALIASKDPATDLNAGLVPPEPTALPIKSADMWALPRVRDATLSPDGAMVVMELRASKGHAALELIDMARGSSHLLATAQYGFGTLMWKDDRTLVAGVATGKGEQLRIIRIGEATGDKRTIDAFEGPVGGRIVDILPDSPGSILYEAVDPDGVLVVHELGIRNALEAGSFRKQQTRNRLNRGVENDIAWYTDGSGRLRAALARRGQNIVLMHGSAGKFHQVMRFNDGQGFEPLRMSADGELIYGLDDTGRGQRDLVVFDPARKEVTRTLFSKPGVDVSSPFFSDRGEPIGVSYYVDGRRVSEYFAASETRVAELIARSLPGRTAVPYFRSRDGKRMLLWVDSSDRPPQLYFFDTKQNEAQLLDDYLPDLARRRFTAAQVIKVPGALSTSIDSFLTLPAGEGRRPMVVLPHGGPIGVADRLHFDREVQFIASMGYAVLQVNFRGSEGYGRAFRESGQGQFGTGIEDDIDAAIKAVIAAHPVDPGRMCILGTSYGGYSALVSAIRWPDRFRCAVSISGVTDRLLLFTASDSAISKNGRDGLIRWMGDPRSNEATLRAASPLYQVDKLRTPVMIVHGRQDVRVDFEHARRLVRMLNIDGRTPVVQAFPDEGHGIADDKAQALAWNGIAGFLQQHLGVQETQ